MHSRYTETLIIVTLLPIVRVPTWQDTLAIL